MTHLSFRSQFKRLVQIPGYAEHNLAEGYQILPQVYPEWKKADRRILFVIESMDRVDLKEGVMFTSSHDKKGNEQNLMRNTVPNILEQSWLLYQEYLGRNSLEDDPESPNAAIAFVNFNAKKYFHLKDFRRTNVLIECGKRVREIVERMKPTDVVIFGDTAASFTLPTAKDRELLPYKRGWVVKRDFGSHRCKVMNTLDLEPLYNSGGDEDDDDSDTDASGKADLLYYVCRHLMNAWAGRMLHKVAHVKPKPIMVDSIKKFDRLFAKLWNFDGPIGYDTETENLESYNNKFYTHQYAFSDEEAYVVPIEHPNSPFDAEEVEYIKRKLRKLWSARNPARIKEFVGINLAFDIRVTRALLDVPIIYHKLWDLAAAESLLDENLSLFNLYSWRWGNENLKTPQYNLRQITVSYGSDLYWPKAQGGSGSNEFGKENRATIRHRNIMEDVDVQNYCALDAQFPLAVRKEQIERARHIRISKRRTYDGYFVRHVINQMSNTVHGTSHMYQNGSHVDVDYLQHLTTKESPLLQVRKDTNAELMKMPSVQEANEILLKGKNMRTKGLFAQAVNVFDIQKPDSLHTLFFEVLGLEPLSRTATGKPSIDKAFLKEYGPTVREAELVTDNRAAQKLQSTYVKGWLERLKKSIDSMKDHCLRPSFGFLLVTGRLNSRDPNLQQVPSRGLTAYIIKLAFTPRKGRVNMAWDFNAAEVRMAAVLALDEALAESFRIGTRLRQALIQSFDAEEKAELFKKLKTEGDVHILNVKKFFGQWVDKSHPLRSAIKEVVFGALYGKSLKSLARDLFNEAKYRHRAIIIALEKEIAKLKKGKA